VSKRKDQIKDSLVKSFNMSYKKSMHDVLGSEKSIELVEEVFDILWENRFVENRKSVQSKIEDTIERYVKSS